jgi:hypothetical protein
VPGHWTVERDLDRPALDAEQALVLRGAPLEADVEAEAVDVEVLRDVEIADGKDGDGELRGERTSREM